MSDQPCRSFLHDVYADMPFGGACRTPVGCVIGQHTALVQGPARSDRLDVETRRHCDAIVLAGAPSRAAGEHIGPGRDVRHVHALGHAAISCQIGMPEGRPKV